MGYAKKRGDLCLSPTMEDVIFLILQEADVGNPNTSTLLDENPMDYL